MSDFQLKASTAEVSEILSGAPLLRMRLEQPNEGGAPGFTLDGGTNKIIQENRTNKTIQKSEANITIEESGPKKTIEVSVTNKTIGKSGLPKDQNSLLKYILRKQLRKKMLHARAHEIGDTSNVVLETNEAAGTQPIHDQVYDNSAPKSGGQ